MQGNVNAIPTIEVKLDNLPSRGVPYPKGAKLSYRTYTFGQVREASTSSFDVASSLRKTISGLVCSNLDPYELTVSDALYLGIMRKVSTFHGMDLEVPYVCLKCQSPNKGAMTERHISFKDLDEKIESLPIGVTINGHDLELSPMTVKQFLDLSDGKYAKVLMSDKITETAIHASFVRNMEFEEAYRIISSTTNADDMEVLYEIEQLFKHDLERVEFKCSNNSCGHINKVRLEGREALLRPFRSGESSARSRIRFSPAPVNESNGSGSVGVQSSDANEQPSLQVPKEG